MSFLKQMPHWLLADIILFILALFFKFAMRGYGYIAFALIYAAALVTLCRFAPDALWKTAVIVTTVGLMYFYAVEGLIIGSARTDRNVGEKKYIVVLGAAVLDDRPSLALIHRMEGAMKYLDTHPGSTAILCGGQGKGESMTEADCMYDWLTAQGVDPDRLIKEDRSTTTMENLQNAFAIIERRGDTPDGSIAIVSSCYHLYRAKCMAKLLGAEASGVSGSLGYPIYTLNCFIREAFGVTHLWVFGK